MTKKIKDTVLNIGTGKDYTIRQYAKIIANHIYPEGKINIKYDKTKPNGTQEKF